MTKDEIEKSRRFKVLRVSLDLLPDLLRAGKNGRYVRILGMPDDAVIVGSSSEAYFAYNEIAFRVWSASFEQIPFGQPMPELVLATQWVEATPP